MIAKMIPILSLFLFISLIFSASSEGQQNYQLPKPSRHDHPEIPRINSFEAMEIYKQGKLILANAHESDDFARKHIVGSVSLPNGKVQGMNIKLPSNFIIAFYCE